MWKTTYVRPWRRGAWAGRARAEDVLCARCRALQKPSRSLKSVYYLGQSKLTDRSVRREPGAARAWAFRAMQFTVTHRVWAVPSTNVAFFVRP